MHNVEVDQSGRTDVLTDDTVLAFSDEIQAAIIIPAPGQACHVALAARSCPRVDTGDRLATQLCLEKLYHTL